MRADTPGLVVVMCDLCSAPAIVNDALLLVRSTSVAPLVAVLSWEQLQEPGAVLGDLLGEVGDQVRGEPLLAPRVLLPLLLTRDVDADASDPGRVADEVCAEHGAELGDVYTNFLSLAVEQHAEAETDRGLQALLAIPVEQLPGWLDDHPQVAWPASLALLDQIRRRADAAGDAAAAGMIGLAREMLGAVAAGTLAAEAVAACRTSMVEHFDLYGGPELERLWVAADAPEAEQAIHALREILAHFPDVDQTGLGLALTNRPDGASPSELDEAIEWLARGLTRRSPEASLDDWSYSKINLGHALRRRNGPGDLDHAIGHHRDAKDRLRGTPLTRQLIYAECNLASALTAADSSELVEALAVAAAAAGRAAQLDDASVLGWALRVQGDAHAALNGPQSPAAVAAWQHGIDVLDVIAHPGQLLNNAGQLCEAYAATKAWEPLAALYERMLAAFDALFTAQATGDARRHVLTNHPLLA